MSAPSGHFYEVGPTLFQRAVKEAEACGAVVAYPPTRQGQRGMFAIVIQGGVQHGLWER